MSTCDICQSELCEVPNCNNFADWNGWVRVIEPFDIPTGVMQRRNICEEHKMLLIGFQNKKDTGCKSCDKLLGTEICLKHQLEEKEYIAMQAMNEVERLK